MTTSGGEQVNLKTTLSFSDSFPRELPELALTRPVAVSEHDVEVLENVGQGLCRLGAPDAGMVLLGIVAAWRLAR
jgi:hypothetical protein